RDAQDRGAPRRAPGPGRDPSDDVRRALVRPSSRRRRAGGDLPRAREGGARGPGTHGAGGVSLLAHARVGTGSRAVFLLHGFLGSARNLATLARGLAQHLPDRSAISLDLTGHGESPPLPPHPDLAIIARHVVETARALEAAAPSTLLVHSPDGRLAL